MTAPLISLPTMLGIRPGMCVSLLNVPADLKPRLLEMPEGVALTDTAKTGIDCTLFFTMKKLELVEKLPQLARGMSVMGSIWVCFPTVADSPHAPSEDFIRLAALELGLTDNKKLLLDPMWTGLRLVWRPRAPRIEKPQVSA